MPEHIYESIAATQHHNTTNIAEYGSGGLLIAATAGYVAVKAHLWSKRRSQETKLIPNLYRMPPASPSEKLIDDPEIPEPQVMPKVPQEQQVSEPIEEPEPTPKPAPAFRERNRETAPYLLTFFDLSSVDSETDQKRDEIARLSRSNVPEDFPDGRRQK